MLDLAFDLATWHAYAKLRKHTKHSLDSLRSQSKELGKQFRVFLRKTCSQYRTKRLPGEAAACGRRRVAAAKKGSSATQKKSVPRAQQATEGDQNLRPFNLATYKIHALADYADHIERFGPTDCFTTQHVRRAPQVLPSASHTSARVNSNTVESSDSTGAQTRFGSLARLQSKSGFSAIFVSTLPL